MAKASANTKKQAADDAALQQNLNWVPADGGYELALNGKKLVCKNAKGKTLASVPKKVKDSDVAGQLIALRDYLVEHERDCREQVESWMLRSLPVPRAVLEAVWPDDAWRSLLENAVVWPLNKKGEADEDSAGFFRGVDAKKGIGVVDLDGETQWLKAEQVALPHPILLQELADFRELATELGVEQGLPQLFRETFRQPEDVADDKEQVDDFSNGKFNTLMQAVSRARSLGLRVKGGNCRCPIVEDGRQVEARYWLGDEYPEYETYTGELVWVDDREHRLKVGDIGPVAYSEGMRMASAIYAHRVVEDKSEED